MDSKSLRKTVLNNFVSYSLDEICSTVGASQGIDLKFLDGFCERNKDSVYLTSFKLCRLLEIRFLVAYFPEDVLANRNNILLLRPVLKFVCGRRIDESWKFILKTQKLLLKKDCVSSHLVNKKRLCLVLQRP